MTKKTMKKNKKVHLIGICGKGMSGLALLYKQAGFQVSGSDSSPYGATADTLRKNGIKFAKNYSAKNIPVGVSKIIISKHAELTPEHNKEVAAAFKSGMKIKSLPEALGELASNTHNTVVAGSFGKSTVTALLTWCLVKSKKDPSYFIGGTPLNMPKSAKLGKNYSKKNHQFILEGDEYPSSNWDNTSKFLYLHPENLILISGEHDHINVFPTENEYIKPYKDLVAMIPKTGLIVISSEAKNISQIVKKAKCRVVSYGFSNKSLWHPENIRYGKTSTFFLYKGREKIALLKTSLLGNHNIENIVGVCAFLLEKKLMKPRELFAVIKSFKGVSGRLDLKTSKSAIPVYEGFGSSYSKAKSVFDALQLHFPNRRIITVFEPHTFSWRNHGALKWYKDIFDGISDVILLPPPAHGKDSHEQLSYDEIYNEIKKHVNVQKASTEKGALKIIKSVAREGDVIALVSSGSLLGLTRSVPRLIESLF